LSLNSYLGRSSRFGPTPKQHEKTSYDDLKQGCPLEKPSYDDLKQRCPLEKPFYDDLKQRCPFEKPSYDDLKQRCPLAAQPRSYGAHCARPSSDDRHIPSPGEDKKTVNSWTACGVSTLTGLRKLHVVRQAAGRGLGHSRKSGSV